MTVERIPLTQKTTRTRRFLILSAALLLLTSLTLSLQQGDFNLKFEDPANNSNVSGSVLFNVSADAIDNVTNVTFYHNRSGWTQFDLVNNSTASTTGSRFFNTTNDTSIFLEDGAVWINATARNATHTNWTRIRITVDNTPPFFNITTPIQKENISGTVEVNITFNDSTTSAETKQYRWFNSSGNVTGWRSLNDTYITDGNLSDDVYTLEFYVNDTVGNVNRTNRTVHVDNNGPTIDWIVPAARWINTRDPNITAEITDFSGVNNDTLKFEINDSGRNFTYFSTGSAQFGNDFKIFHFNNSLKEGQLYSVSIGAIDTSPNRFTSNHTFNFSIDSVNPNATDDLGLTRDNETSLNTSTVGDRILKSEAVGLNWSFHDSSTEINDNISGVDHLEVWAQNRSYDRDSLSFPGSFNNWYRLKNVPSGSNFSNITNVSSHYQYRFKLRVVDKAENFDDSNIINVTIDGRGPELSLDSNGNEIRAPTNWSNSSNPEISLNITDPSHVDNSSIKMKIFNTSDDWSSDINVTLTPFVANSTNSTEYRIVSDSTPTLTHGETYAVQVNSTDVLGTNSTIEWNFTVDTKSPNTVSVKDNFTNTTYKTWYKDSLNVQISCSGDPDSGIKDAAAFVGSDRVTDWNESVSSGKANLTLTESGNNTYKLTCRDVAGNMNQTVTRRYAVDSITPQINISSADPADNVDDQPTSFTFSVEFSNESLESGVNLSDSSITLEKGDNSGSLTNVEWTNWSVSADLESLDKDVDVGGYEVRVAVTDKMGKGDIETFDFGTESSSTTEEETTQTQTQTTAAAGGGNQSEEFLTLSGVPDLVALPQGSFVVFQFDIENAKSYQHPGIGISFDAGDLDAVVLDSGFDLAGGESTTVRINVSAGSDVPPNIYTGDINIDTDFGVSKSTSVEVEVVGGEPNLEIDAPSSVDVPRGGTASENIDIENQGGSGEDLNASFVSGNLTGSLEPSIFDIAARGETTLNLTVSSSGELPIGIYEGSILVEHSGGEDETSIDFKVQPASENEKEEIKREIERLRQRLQRLKEEANETNTTNENITEIQTLIQEANRAIEEGDYAQATVLQKEIESKMPNTGFNIPTTPLVIILGVLILFGGAGFAYGTREDIDLDLDLAGLVKKLPSLHRSAQKRLTDFVPTRGEARQEYSYQDRMLREGIKRKMDNSRRVLMRRGRGDGEGERSKKRVWTEDD